MSLLVLDDQLAASEVLLPLRKWSKVKRLRDLLPAEQILDDRVPEILLKLHQPTFVTIDQGFWDRNLCNMGYCTLYFALRDDQQEMLPGLLQKLLRKTAFRTRTFRMGKVAPVSSRSIDTWRFKSSKLLLIHWN